MAGVPTTQKVNLQIAGNLILAGAGSANFVPAALANLAYTVVNSNQSNITRVGTLNINTFKVSGGTNGQYIQTDGAGNLSWVSGGGSGNGVVGGSNGQIQFNNAGSFAGNGNLVWDNANARLGVSNIASNSVTVYGNVAAVNISASANVRPNAIYTNHYFYSNGVPFTGGTGISGITVKDEGTNVVASANTINFVGAGVTASNVSGVATITINGVDGNITSTGNVNVTSNNNTWTFNTDGNLSAPGSGYFAGQNLFVGPGSDVFPNLGGSTLVISSTDSAYVQAAIVNVSDNGSADWTAYGHRGSDAGGWIDMGFNSSGYNDPNYTITGQGDGAITLQSYFDGQSPGGRGGNLILATGENGTTNDIVFATNGFLAENEFGRISSANNALQFTSGGNLSGANVITANSFVGNGANITNVPISWTTAPVSNTSSGNVGQAAYDSGGNLFICVAIDTWTKITGTTSW
jgi:hypothetical protein